MLYTVIEWVYYVCCMVCMVCVGEWTFHWTVKSWKRFVIAGTVYVVGFILGIVVYSDTFLFACIFYLSEIISWILICNPQFKGIAVRIVVLTVTVGIVEAIMYILVDIICGKIFRDEVLRLVSIVLTFIIFYIIGKRNWYQTLVLYLNSMSRGKIVLTICVISFGGAVASFGNVVQGMLNNYKATMFFRFLIAIYLCSVIIIVACLIVESYQKKYYLEQSHLKEEIIRTQQDYYKAIYEKDKEMRSFRHDVASQIGLLQMLLDRGDIQKAKEQLTHIYQDFSQASFHKISIGDDMLDAILSMMNQKAIENEVKLEVTGELTGKNNYDVYELCTIFSNAIGNSIDACGKYGEKVVWVKVMYHKKTLCCFFENPATEEMYQAVIKEETTKEDRNNHGYGVRNIKQAVERLNGSMEYHYEKGKIRLEIYI